MLIIVIANFLFQGTAAPHIFALIYSTFWAAALITHLKKMKYSFHLYGKSLEILCIN